MNRIYILTSENSCRSKTDSSFADSWAGARISKRASAGAGATSVITSGGKLLSSHDVDDVDATRSVSVLVEMVGVYSALHEYGMKF